MVRCQAATNGHLHLSCGLCAFLSSLRAQCHCLWPNSREGPPSACPPTPTTPSHPHHPLPPTHRLISAIHDITVVVKHYLKNQQWVMHGRVSYKTVAISLLYLYSKSCVAMMQHRRITAASMLQNGISLNTKCNILWLVYPNPVTYCHNWHCI